jgi:hypothetical protein
LAAIFYEIGSGAESGAGLVAADLVRIRSKTGPAPTATLLVTSPTELLARFLLNFLPKEKNFSPP